MISQDARLWEKFFKFGATMWLGGRQREGRASGKSSETRANVFYSFLINYLCKNYNFPTGFLFNNGRKFAAFLLDITRHWLVEQCHYSEEVVDEEVSKVVTHISNKIAELQNDPKKKSNVFTNYKYTSLL